MMDEWNRAQPGNWNPLRIAPVIASRTPAKRVSALTRPARADFTVAQILQLITNMNMHGAAPHVRTDFNSTLMGQTLDPEARVSFALALQRLVAAGMLMRHSESEYSLTAAGAYTMRRPPVRRGRL
jgi:hypothetical protein